MLLEFQRLNHKHVRSVVFKIIFNKILSQISELWYLSSIKHNDIWSHTQHPFAFQENQEFKFVSAIQFGTEINKHALSKVRDEITMKDMEEIIKNVLLSRSSGKYSTQWKSDTFNLLFKISVKCGPMVSLVRLNEYSTSMCKFWNLLILAHIDNISGGLWYISTPNLG